MEYTLDTRMRVKLYQRNENRVWEDKGTGHVTCAYSDRHSGMSLLVRSETDGSQLLDSRIEVDNTYEIQQGTLIVWSEGETTDFALSFQEKSGCEEVWEKIRQNLPVAQSGNLVSVHLVEEHLVEEVAAVGDQSVEDLKREIELAVAEFVRQGGTDFWSNHLDRRKRHLTMEKLRNLPLVCVETICKFTPTSQLIRLCSIAVPLPGAFWELGLEAVLKKRLPHSLGDDLSCHRPGEPDNAKALFDVTGAQIATVKKPDQFRFSPLRELVESATLTVRCLPYCLKDNHPGARAVHGDTLLSHMPNVDHLSLVLHEIDYNYQSKPKDRFGPCLKHLVPQLKSFEVSISRYSCGVSPYRMVADAFVNFIEDARINEMRCLRRLVLPEATFGYFMETVANQPTLQAVLAGLRSLGIPHMDVSVPTYIEPAAVLNFVSLNCGQLSQLQVFIRGEFRAYVAAFRALPGLTSLGLDVCNAYISGLVFDGSSVICSVLDLRIAFPQNANENRSTSILLTITTFFPNVKVVALKASKSLDLATSLFGEKQFFSTVAKLAASAMAWNRWMHVNGYRDFSPIRICPRPLIFRRSFLRVLHGMLAC